MKSCCNLFTIMILFLLYSCNNTINQPNPQIIERTMSVNINNEVIFELELHADGGYQWEYSISDTTVLQIDSINYRPKSGDWSQDGGITIEKFYFTAKRSGQCIILLNERRIWEEDIAPINSVKYSINVLPN